jgi:1-acyl-sn-glycerol-3-phosphate acyltransferase
MLARVALTLARVFYRLRTQNISNIPSRGAAVIAFNHAAPIVDALTVAVILLQRPDCVMFAGRGLPTGRFLSRLAAKPHNSKTDQVRLSAYKARAMSAGELLKAHRFLREGRAVALAAEGELSWDGRLQYPLAPGAAWMALKANAPVVAVVSHGGYDIMPRWANRPRLFGRVTIRASAPFCVGDGPVELIARPAIDAASDRIFEEMSQTIRLASGHLAQES